MGIQATGFSIAFFLSTFGCAWGVALLIWAKPSKQSPPLDWLEGSFVSLISVLIFLGWVSVLLASFGQFSLTALSGILFVMTVGVFWWQRPTLTLPKFHRCSWREYVLVLLLLGCSFVYFRPHEYVLGGTDAGTYVNIGATIARTGEFVNQEPWLDFLGDYRAVTFREQPLTLLTRYLQFLGWYIGDADATQMIPQFFPFHPTLIAVGMQLAGLAGGLLVTPLWAVLGLVAVYLVTRRLFDAQIALITVFLLAITPTQIYFSRYPTAEPLTLLLVFTGLLAFQTLWDTSFVSPVWGVLGGAAFGAAFLTRIDLLVVFFCAMGMLLLWGLWKRRSPGWWACVLVFGGFSLHAILSALLLNWPYTWNTYSAVGWLLGRQPFLRVLLGLGVVTGGVAIFVLRRWPARCEFWLLRLVRTRWVRLGLAIGLLLCSGYAYFLRPILEPPNIYQNWPSGSQIEVLDGLNWVRIGWYLTPLGLLLATLGLAWMLWKPPLLRLGFFLVVGLLTTAQYVYKAFIPAFHIYMMRRYVPIVIPVLVIGAALALVTLSRWRWRGVGPIVGRVLFLGLTAGLLYQSRALWSHRDGEGALVQVAALAASLREDAVLVISEPQTSLFADMWGVPLHFSFGYDVATVRQDDERSRQFMQQLLLDARKTQRPVQLVARYPVAEVIQTSFYLEPVTAFPVALPYLVSTYDAYPTEIQTDSYIIEVYNVLEKPVVKPVEIDVGTLDTAFVGAGFYGKETLPDSLTARWTAGEATLNIPAVANTSFAIEIRAMTYRLDNVPPSAVQVLLDGQEIGRFVPDLTWQTFFLTGIAHPTSAASRLVLASQTFNPAALGLSADERDLGVFVDWVRVTPALAD